MRIAIVGPAHPYKGGSAQHTTELAHRLARAGHQVRLESWRSQYPKLLYPGQPTVDVPEMELFPDTRRTLRWNRPDGWWLTARRLARQHDVILLSIFTPIQVPPYLTMARAARGTGCAVVALCHNVLPHESSKLDRPAMQALLRRVDAVVVHSEQEAELAESLTGVPVAVAALPLHLPGTGRSSPAHKVTSATAGAGAGPRDRLLFFGIVRRYKGLDILLEALAASKATAGLTVAGEIWAGRDQLPKMIANLGLSDRVMLRDEYIPSEELPALFATADALVLPYRSGTASQNALIAQEFGVPVIATRAGAIADAVQDGVNGILCEPADVASLTSAIDRLYEPGTLERLRAGVRAPDPGPAWAQYIDAVTAACSGRPARQLRAKEPNGS